MSAEIGTLEYWQEVAEAVTDDARKLRAELAALRAERDGLRERIAALEDEKNAYIDYVGDALGQDHDGESLWDAAQRVLSDRDQIRVERDELSEQLTESWISRDEQKARAELAAERERAEKAEADYRFMVERASDQRLDGYRELGQRAADAENDRDTLRAENERLRVALNTAMWAMRQPLDGWKGECERKALDEARAALAEVGR